MSEELIGRLCARYTGQAGEAWARIEREAPATYWEENAVLGRREVYERLLARLQPASGRRILDAGCGRGLLARRLARQGARVTAVDLLADHVLEARDRAGGAGPTFAVADLRDVVEARGAFDEVIVQEVLEDYTLEERLDAFRRLAGCGAYRVHLIFRQPGKWTTLIAPLLPDVLVPTLDPVPLLRSIHLHTPYRLAHQESVRRRSYNVQRVELTLQPELVRSNL